MAAAVVQVILPALVVLVDSLQVEARQAHLVRLVRLQARVALLVVRVLEQVAHGVLRVLMEIRQVVRLVRVSPRPEPW
jgi:hypothetical protein